MGFYDLDFITMVSYTDLFLCMKVHGRFGGETGSFKIKAEMKS